MARKPSTITAHINKGIANLKATKRDIATDIRRMQENRKKYHHILNHIVSPEDGEGYISVTRGEVFVTYRNLTGFKDLRLETTLEGLNFIGDAVRTEDWASLMNRDYSFKVPFADGSSLRVIVSAYVSENSPTCRKVQVGEEYKVVPKYEMICD